MIAHLDAVGFLSLLFE